MTSEPATNEASDKNLPVVAQRTGGALVTVLSDLDRYADGPQPLGRRITTAISRIVAERPELNTEARVAMLVDLAAYHGESISRWLADMLDEHEPEVVYLVVEYFYAIGRRDRTKVAGKSAISNARGFIREDMAEMFDFVERLQAIFGQELTLDDLHQFVVRVGLRAARDMSDDSLERFVVVDDAAVPREVRAADEHDPLFIDEEV